MATDATSSTSSLQTTSIATMLGAGSGIDMMAQQNMMSSFQEGDDADDQDLRCPDAEEGSPRH